MNEMLKKLHEVELKSLSKKMHAYRTTFRTVHRKYNVSCKSESRTDEVEESTLWYYKILLPTAISHGSARQSKSTLDESFFDDKNCNKSKPLMSSLYVNDTQPT